MHNAGGSSSAKAKLSWHGICKGAVRKFILQFWNQLLDIYTNMDNYFIHSYILIRRRFKVYWYITQISYLGVDSHFTFSQAESLQIFCYGFKKNQKTYNQIETLCALNLKFEFTLYHAQYNTHAGSNQTDCKNH